MLIGTPKALAIAVNNNKVFERYTGLKEALIEVVGKPSEIISDYD